jgi:hypothetical protein
VPCGRSPSCRSTRFPDVVYEDDSQIGALQVERSYDKGDTRVEIELLEKAKSLAIGQPGSL